MFAETLLACALLAAQTPALPDQLVISVVVTDKKGKPIADLTASEVTVKEGSASQPVTRLEADTRPLDEDSLQVVLHRLLAHAAQFGDLAVAGAVHDRRDDVQLACREPGGRTPSRRMPVARRSWPWPGPVTSPVMTRRE